MVYQETKKPVVRIINNKVHVFIDGQPRDNYKKSNSKRVRVNNPKNHKSFALRQRNTKNGRKGQFKGLYKISKK